MKVLHAVFSAFLIFVPCGAFALSAGDTGVVPVQSISDHRWRDANTGRFISAPADAGNVQSGAVVDANAGATTGAGNKSGGNSGTTGNTVKSNAVAPAKKFNAGGAAMGAIGLATGTAGVIHSASGDGEHGWGNVVEGVVGGATAAAGGAAIINAIPVAGQIGYGVAIAVGAVVGGAIAGSQLFSETDCMQDPMTGKFTCCNTEFNQGQRQVDIGGYMFCTEDGKTALAPGIRQCQQGGKGQRQGSWFDQLFEDDAWAVKCVPGYCDVADVPESGLDDLIVYEPDREKICWNWHCKYGNKIKVRNGVYTCGGADQIDQYDNIIRKIETLRQQIISQCNGTVK